MVITIVDNWYEGGVGSGQYVFKNVELPQALVRCVCTDPSLFCGSSSHGVRTGKNGKNIDSRDDLRGVPGG